MLAPDKAIFKLSLVNNDSGANALDITFGSHIDTTKTFTVEPSARKEPFTVSDKIKNFKVWTFTFDTPLDSGTVVTISGSTKKASLLKVKQYSWKVNGVSGPKKKTGVTFEYNRLGLPLPNRINVLIDAFHRGGFSASQGLLVGINRGIDSSSSYSWMLFPSEIAVLLSLGNNPKLIMDGTPHGFDKFVNGTEMTGQKSSVFKQFYNNRLLADMIALKLSLTVSAMGITPVGFGQLIYHDSTSNPLNGKTIEKIALLADTTMMGYWMRNDSSRWVHKFAAPSVFLNLDTTIAKINDSFEGALDTFSFASRMILKGSRPLAQIRFLHSNPNARPTIIVPNNNSRWELPSTYTLYQNYPNPFNPTTTIDFYLPEQSVVSLKVYNILGQEVATLIDNENMDEGDFEIPFDGSNLSSGVYFYQLEVNFGEQRIMKKLLLLK